MRGKGLKYFSGYLILAAIFFSCAKQSAPAGGPIDEEPPVVVSSIPPAGTVNFSHDNFEVTFDEYFVLDGVDQKMLISPPLEKKPEIKVRKKSLIVTFGEELRDSATYTFYFQDAVRDLNEGNPIENFQYVFSTGPVLDSLSVYGTIFNAFDLQPGENIFVVLYSGTSDTLPATTIPTYVTRAEKDGRFRLDNLAGGVYTMYGLRDMNNNKRYDLPDEAFAFMDRSIFLSAETHYTPVADTSVAATDSLQLSDSLVRSDPLAETDLIILSDTRRDSALTILSDTLIVSDSIVVYDTLMVVDPIARYDTLMVSDSLTRSDTLGVPDSLGYMITDSTLKETPADFPGIFNKEKGYSLYLFKSAAERLYLTRSERSNPYRLTFVFSMPVDSGMFNISFPEAPGTDYITRTSSSRDTFNIWITDSLSYSQPVMPVVINYPAVDSAGADITASDTLRLRYIQPARGRGVQAAKPAGTKITVTPVPGKGLPPGSNIIFRAETPLLSTDTSRIYFKQISDTLLKDIPYTFREDSVISDRF
ncbi:MAG: Ig-like domain-containing protein, partial [Bacteroidales bacterium]|nr:Ig-like domain-containing protein [Bacteroidales bacterium]